jgi:hypothetical protein
VKAFRLTGKLPLKLFILNYVEVSGM